MTSTSIVSCPALCPPARQELGGGVWKTEYQECGTLPLQHGLVSWFGCALGRLWSGLVQSGLVWSSLGLVQSGLVRSQSGLWVERQVHDRPLLCGCVRHASSPPALSSSVRSSDCLASIGDTWWDNTSLHAHTTAPAVRDESPAVDLQPCPHHTPALQL